MTEPNLPPLSPKNTSHYFFLTLIALLFVSTMVFGYYLGARNKPTSIPNVVSPSPTLYPTYVPSATPTPITYTELNPGDIAWLDFPKVVKISPFQPADAEGYIGDIIAKDLKYHHVANFTDGSKLINAYVPRQGMGTYTYIERYIQTPDGRLFLNSDPSALKESDTPYQDLKPSTGNVKLKIDGISAPASFDTYKGKIHTYSRFMENIISFTELKNPQLLMETPYGRVYAEYRSIKDKPGLSDRILWLRFKDDTVASYEVVIPFLTDDNVPQIIWEDGSKNQQVYGQGFKGGCGASYGRIIKSNSSLVSDNKVTYVAKTNDEVALYKFIDPKTNLVLDIYEMMDPNNRPDMNTFLGRHNHFLWQDPIGDWWFFISEENMIQAECAKPVIYLYPPTDTQVSVQVGAHVTQSAPTYPQDGWSVLARSSGAIEYNGEIYPNLFWEGTGLGVYPNHSDEGFVVSQENLIPTLNKHLTLLGLNKSESQDFLDFWLPKLPVTPFVRLTWLKTADMDQLAPLNVYPRPQTSIRIFLEFQGLNNFVSLKPQVLNTLPRQGFTLVEWGGLLLK